MQLYLQPWFGFSNYYTCSIIMGYRAQRLSAVWSSAEQLQTMFTKTLLFVTFFSFLGKTASQDVSPNDRQCVDNPTGTVSLNVDVRGVPGPEGPRGRRGPKGNPGETGVKGDPGMRGDRGLPGDTGPIGTTGNKGETGGKGQKGSRGVDGPIGPTGRPGFPGPPGIQGEPGDTVLNSEDFDRMCERVLNKLNVSILSEIIERINALNTTLNPPISEHTSNTTLSPPICGRALCGFTSTNWRRIAYFDTTRGDPCPPGLHTSNNNATGQTACGTTNGTRSELSLKFPTGGNYTNVCGRVRGYSGWNVYAFFPYIQRGRLSINDNYADGVLITRGNPRRHLWTYAAALAESYLFTNWLCPCTRPGYNPSGIPRFVGNNYYCESGFYGTGPSGQINWNDPLWDGKGCYTSTCCERFGWFHRQVPSTNDDIEVRWSKEYSTTPGENIVTDQLEIWVM